MGLLEAETLSFWDRLIVGAKVTINGVVNEYPIFKTVTTDDTLKKFLYLQTVVGTVTKAIVIDSQGREVRHKEMNITKGEDGLMIAFTLSIEVKEDVNV